MKINVKAMGLLSLEGIKNGTDVEVSDGTTVSSFLDAYVTNKQHHKFVIVTVNDRKVDRLYAFNSDDRLAMFLPFGAG